METWFLWLQWVASSAVSTHSSEFLCVLSSSSTSERSWIPPLDRWTGAWRHSSDLGWSGHSVPSSSSQSEQSSSWLYRASSSVIFRNGSSGPLSTSASSLCLQLDSETTSLVRLLFSYQKFIDSFWIFLKRLFKSTTTQRRSRLQHWYCVGVNTSKRNKQLWVNDLPNVPTWRQDWNSNPRPSGRKALKLPLSRHCI